MDPTPSEITRLLHEASEGEPGAIDRLIPVVYGELRRLAASQLRRERTGHTLTPTALVHEAFFRIVDQRAVSWEGRTHFFGIAAQAMRRILVDHARKRSAQKRDSKMAVTLDSSVDIGAPAQSEEIVAIDEALTRLALIDERQARLVELRYFVGLSIEETGDVLGISAATVKRDWTLARAWLQRELGPVT